MTLSAVHVVRRIVRNRSAVLAAASPAHRHSFPSLIINGCCRRRGGGLRWLCAFERGGDGGAELHTRSELTPYQVLGVPRHATDQYIRAAYRELVRKLHPDRGGPEASAAAMADVTSAYQELTRGKSLLTARDSRVANKVHGAFSVADLFDDAELDVVQVVVSLDELIELTGSSAPEAGSDDDDDDDDDDEDDPRYDNPLPTGALLFGAAEEEGAEGALLEAHATHSVRVNTTSFDSVADLKRTLQEKHAAAWGLQGRRQSPERLYIGWELVYDSYVLGENFFLGDYGIKSGDHLYAVIRRND